MSTTNITTKIKSNPKLKKFIIWTISGRNPRPRLWVRLFLTPIIHKKGKGAKIRRNNRLDIFPWHKFSVGSYATIESYTTINNGSGDIILGDESRVGIGSVLIGPVTMERRAGLGQHVFISGFNHGYSDGSKDSNLQPLDIRPTVIGEEAHIGANSVVVAGVTIGKRCQVGAGSVVTKDIPPFSVAVGNPAKVIKRYNPETQAWEKV